MVKWSDQGWEPVLALVLGLVSVLATGVDVVDIEAARALGVPVTHVPEYGTRERHCNSASRIHSGGGSLPVTRKQVATANCVRVLVRCSGTCG